MACTTKQAADILWTILSQLSEGSDDSCRFVNRNSPDQNKVNSTVRLHDGRLVLNAVCVFHRYDECEHTVLVGTTRWAFPTSGIRFEGHHWTVISPTLSDPSYSSVVQSCYRLQPKVTDAASILPTDLESARGLVMGILGKKMLSAMQLMQNALLCQLDLGPCMLK
ncbi:hypothetical protein L917_21213 [Phytophthora nicotianae]|nr:hypothetical protein L917_21213 [Phytophthora nicotianae]ETM31169.1 hypothetical protein L914_21222 [Phytophthora nicotianae]